MSKTRDDLYKLPLLLNIGCSTKFCIIEDGINIIIIIIIVIYIEFFLIHFFYTPLVYAYLRLQLHESDYYSHLKINRNSQFINRDVFYVREKKTNAL